MRVLLFCLFASLSRGDTIIPSQRPSEDFALVRRGCELLRAKVLSTQVLRLLGAIRVNNGMSGWSGDLTNSRFSWVTAGGDYDDDAIPQELEFSLPPGKSLTKKEVRRFQSSSCEVHYRPPDHLPDWPAVIVVVAP